MSGGEDSKGQWDLEDVAGYLASALTQASREGEWPDSVAGNAPRLLIQDLGEFAEAMVASARASYWSVTKALERAFIERLEVLMGSSASESVAKRYLDSVAEVPTAERPNRRAKRARPEDALAEYFSKTGMGKDDVSAFRSSWIELKNTASEWFVHPTAMGPLLSRSTQESSDEAVDHWCQLIQLLSHGCIFAVAAANPLKVTIPVEVLRAIYAAGSTLQQCGKSNGETLLEIHAAIAERTVPRERPGSANVAKVELA